MKPLEEPVASVLPDPIRFGRMPEKTPSSIRRHALGAVLDRFVTPLLGLGGKWIRRPTDGELSEQSGRVRGGGDSIIAVAALESGRRALSDAHYSEALVQFALAIERDAQCMWAWHGRGDAFQLADDPEAALVAYDRALELDPQSSLSHLGRGNALMALNRVAEARAAWLTTLEMEPKNHWAKTALAELDAT
jgi:tetratricopeptide (TPR) repeat protein